MRSIGLTWGDPAGIGAEVLLGSLPRFLGAAQWVVFAHPADFRDGLGRYRASLEWSDWTPGRDGRVPGLYLSPTGVGGEAVRPGDASAGSGRRAMAALEAATTAAVSGRLDAIVTAPVAKRLMGTGFIGQTEFLRARAGVPSVAMTFFTRSFKVAVATTHLSLRQALDSLTEAGYVDLLRLIDRELGALGLPSQRIAVSGVNPHAGEGGLFGREEQDILAPAVRAAVAAGVRASGPWPADTCYARARAGEFDVVLAPYHDQGLIPVKLIAPGEAANVTLGLPFVRTSPDHGTAFEIAGQGVARTDGMASALEWAVELVEARSRQS
jgi:4-hydroxythreonine-4-phosphate dehydrogenase